MAINANLVDLDRSSQALRQVYRAPVREGRDTGEGAELVNYTRIWDQHRLDKERKAYIADLYMMRKAFTDADLGVTLDVTKAVAAINGDPLRVRNYAEHRFGGRVFANQLRTAIEAFKKMARDPYKSGLVIGGMQSGKTGTSSALHLFPPMYYLALGRRFCPVHLLTNFTSHEEQTKDEIKNFYELYGDIEFVMTEGGQPHADCDFFFIDNPSPNTYRKQVLNAESAVVDVFIRRRVHGKNKKKSLGADFSDLRARGLHPIVIVDESQHGATEQESRKKLSDDERDSVGDTDNAVLSLSRQTIEQEIGEDTQVPFICLSATPWDLDALTADTTMWVVRQHLAPTYVGYNYYLGEPLDRDVQIREPTVLNFADYGKKYGVAKFRFININLYNQIQKTLPGLTPPIRQRTILGMTIGQKVFDFRKFQKWAAKIDYPCPPGPCTPAEQRRILTDYCKEVEDSLRRVIYAVARSNRGVAKCGEPLGICVRFCNSNTHTQNLLARLNLDPKKISMVQFFDHTTQNLASVKQILRHHHVEAALHGNTQDVPYLMVCTARARMGDAFPSSCEHFIDFSNSHDIDRPTTMNALLQGLLGRACGVGKNPTVCLSPANVSVIEGYKASLGGLRRDPSRHARIESHTEQRRVTLAKIRYGLHDKIDTFLDRVNAEIVMRAVQQYSVRLDINRRAFGNFSGHPNRMMAPIMRIAQEEGILEFIEANPQLLVPDMPLQRVIVEDGVPFQIARTTDTVRAVVKNRLREYRYDYPRGPNNQPDPAWQGFIAIQFRHNRADATGRYRRGFESADPDEVRIHRARSVDGTDSSLFFQLMISKINPRDNAVRPNPKSIVEGSILPVNRRCTTIVMPLLRETVFEGSSRTGTVPSRGHWLRNKQSTDVRARIEGVYDEEAERRAIRATRRSAREAV